MTGQFPDRIEQLKNSIVAYIPVDTTKKKRTEHRNHLARQPISTIMLVYVNFAERLIVPRRRRVVYMKNFWSAPDALEIMPQVHQLATEIESGIDLSPRLSRKVKFRGYRPNQIDKKGCFVGDRWWNKDFALNVYGVHHLHLAKAGAHEHQCNSGRLIFVQFFRDGAVMLMIGDHKSFFLPDIEKTCLTFRASQNTYVLPNMPLPRPEDDLTAEERICLAKGGITTGSSIDGQFVMNGPISADGTSEYCSFQSQRILQALFHFDPLIDDTTWVANHFKKNNVAVPGTPEFEWCLHGSLPIRLTPTATRSSVGHGCPGP